MKALSALPLASDCFGGGSAWARDPAFSVAFQPIVDVTARRVYAYEALVRGPAGEPARAVLDRVTGDACYRLDQACHSRAITLALDLGLIASGARLSMNILPNAVCGPDDCIRRTLATACAHGLPAERLIFELTEREEVTAPDRFAALVEAYRLSGVSIAIDDFGAGQSGLDLFARVTPDIVKLDLELVRNIDRDPRRHAIVRAMAGLCAELDTVMIAEGIETAAEAEALRRLGIRYQQGFFYAPPAFEAFPPVRF